ncbi:cytochrome P450 [Lactarius quietus]|nr:cytochrome P450 [Lactarius quietus]
MILTCALRGKSILRDLRGPESKSFGWSEYVYQKETGQSELKWMREYGSAWRVRGCMGVPLGESAHGRRPKGSPYILHTSAYNFPKTLTREIHRRQRKVMAAAFSVPHLKAFLTQFQITASKLAQKWKDEIATDKDHEPILNISEWLRGQQWTSLGKVAPQPRKLHTNGRSAGFDFDFGALDSSHNPVTHMYESLLRYLRDIREVARDIVRKSIVKGDGRDIMSVLLRANNSEDLKSKLSDNEVIDQIGTLLLAGHDTSANTLTWFFWELAKHPESHGRFESMRLHPIVWQLSRSAARDDVIPLAFPITTKSGEQIRLPEVWGEDADQWNPHRFDHVDQKKQISVGLYANLIIEMQVIAATLLENFEFSLPPQTAETYITRKPLVLMVPMVKGLQYPWMGLKVRCVD